MHKKIVNLPIVGVLVKWSKKAVIPWTNGLRLYDFLKIYIKGLSQGILSYRASSIAYSFFMSIFPFLLFVLILIQYIYIDIFLYNFLRFMYILFTSLHTVIFTFY